MQTRKCVECGETKPVTEYTTTQSRSRLANGEEKIYVGYRSNCKKCYNLRSKTRPSKMSEEAIALRFLESFNSLSALLARYYIDNPEAGLQQNATADDLLRYAKEKSKPIEY